MKEYYEQVAMKLTIAQISGAIAWAIIALQVLLKFVKEFKEVKTFLTDAYCKLKSWWLWAYKKAMWRKQFSELMVKQNIVLEQMEKRLGSIESEVKYNGGKYKLTDAVKDIQIGQIEMKGQLKENAAIRRAHELCSDKMSFWMDAEGRCTFISEAFLRHFGCQESDVIAYNFENIVHDDDRHEMRLKWNKAIDTKTKYRDEQRIKKCGTGEFVKVLVKAEPVEVDSVLKSFYGTIEIIND